MRTPRASIAPLSALFLVLSGCALETTSPEGEAVTETAEPLTSMLASYSPSPMEVTNGKRIVLVGGVLHAVYATGGAVKYVSSTDGVTWTAPVTVDASASQNPTIAVAADGTVGVAFVRNAVSGAGNVHYARKVSSVFQPSFLVTSNGDATGSRTPSLVADGNTFHLAWANGVYVKYVSFPSSQTTSLSSTENVYAASGNSVYQPAVMVGPGPAGSKTIRVAFIDNITPASPSPGALMFWIKERGASSWNYAYYQGYSYSSTAQVVSISADINPSTGDAYVAGSWVTDGNGQTVLVRESAVTAGFAFALHELYPSTAAQVSVAARTEACQSRFRVVTSTPYSGHGAASYRTGSWTSGASPTWIEPAAVSLPGTGRAGTALLQSLPIPDSASSRFFHGTYEDSFAGAFRLFDSYSTGMTPALCD